MRGALVADGAGLRLSGFLVSVGPRCGGGCRLDGTWLSVPDGCGALPGPGQRSRCFTDVGWARLPQRRGGWHTAWPASRSTGDRPRTLRRLGRAVDRLDTDGSGQV